MAIKTVTKPKNLKKGGMGTPPSPDEPVPVNLNRPSSNEEVGITFMVSPELRKEMKSYANERDMTLKDVIIQSYEDYKKRNPI